MRRRTRGANFYDSEQILDETISKKSIFPTKGCPSGHCQTTQQQQPVTTTTISKSSHNNDPPDNSSSNSSSNSNIGNSNQLPGRLWIFRWKHACEIQHVLKKKPKTTNKIDKTIGQHATNHTTANQYKPSARQCPLVQTTTATFVASVSLT